MAREQYETTDTTLNSENYEKVNLRFLKLPKVTLCTTLLLKWEQSENCSLSKSYTLSQHIAHFDS